MMQKGTVAGGVHEAGLYRSTASCCRRHPWSCFRHWDRVRPVTQSSVGFWGPTIQSRRDEKMVGQCSTPRGGHGATVVTIQSRRDGKMVGQCSTPRGGHGAAVVAFCRPSDNLGRTTQQPAPAPPVIKAGEAGEKRDVRPKKTPDPSYCRVTKTD